MSAHLFYFFSISIILYLKINNKLFKKYSYEWSDSPLWAIKHVKIFLMSTHECSPFPILLTSNRNPSLLSTGISYTPIIFVEYTQNLQKISPVSAHKSLWVLTRSFWVLIPLQMMQICFLTMSQRFISTIEFISYIV